MTLHGPPIAMRFTQRYPDFLRPPEPTAWEKLLTQWDALTDDDRRALLAEVIGSAGFEAHHTAHSPHHLASPDAPHAMAIISWLDRQRFSLTLSP